MDEKNRSQDKNSDPAAQKSHSAFPKRSDSPVEDKADKGDTIPSQPRSFSPVRPQRTAVPRKSLATPGMNSSSATSPSKPVDPAAAPKVEDKKPESSPLNTVPAMKSIRATNVSPEPAGTNKTSESAPAKDDEKNSTRPSAGAAVAAAVAASSTASGGADRQPPQSSGAGGDTVRLRIQPRQHARTLNTAPGRGMRRRLPDIRQGKPSKTVSASSYGPFSLMFGFFWLIFKMVFFTALVLGLGALIGFMVMTEYIKTPEVIVPEVSGMKIDEAFEVLSDKKLGIIKIATESSGLVAPGEIISQQPEAGAKAKENTDVGVVISSGRSRFVVPSVINETRENAINKIQGARLEVGTVLTIESDGVPRGNVISQDPIGDSGFDEPTEVDLMISAGPPGKSLTMPDLAGRTVLEATAALKAVGIENVVTEPADAEPDDKVESHSPLVGKTVFQTDQVTLVTD